MSSPIPVSGQSFPVSADLMAQASTTYDAVQMTGERVLWIENRPSEGRRDVLVSWTAGGGVRDALPIDHQVATRVHEYGGGAYIAAAEDSLWFSDAADERLWRSTKGVAEPVTPLGSARYADMRLVPGAGLLVCVRERHEHDQVVNELVTLSANSMSRPRVIASGWDFYSCPRPSPDGRMLAWVTWRPPYMPWDASWLWLASLSADGRPDQPRLIAGGPGESILQPQWSPDGILHFISDRNGWWNLYALRGGHVHPVLAINADLGAAPWEFGYCTYAFLQGRRIGVLVQEGGRNRLTVVDSDSGQTRDVPLPYTSIKPYLVSDGTRVALIGSSLRRSPAVALADCDSGRVDELTGGETVIDPSFVTEPEPFAFSTRDGASAYGHLCTPIGRPSTSASADRPPLIVRAHAGPTHNWPMRLDLDVQYFTSRGFAVADIDYRGSTGYGRAYRQALQQQWGVRDPADCTDAAHQLAAHGRVDPHRMIISGMSAGGYTALRAVTSGDTFAAAAARFTVADPLTWRRAAPKFQAAYCDGLIGEWPAYEERYHQRSTLEHSEWITVPVLLLHGDHDPVTPLAQARALARALAPRAELTIFHGEGHGLRNPHHIRQALELELAHYRAAIGEQYPPPPEPGHPDS